jgi:hypothetical protein
MLLVGGACTVAATVPRGPSEAYLPSAGNVRIWEGPYYAPGLREESHSANYSVDSARYPAASNIEVRISHRTSTGWPVTACIGVVDAGTGEEVIGETCHESAGVAETGYATIGPASLPAGEHTLRLTVRADPPLEHGPELIVESDWVRIRW